MSQGTLETAQGVRTPVAVRSETSRPLDERVLLKFPALVPVAASAWTRLSPHSWLRRAWTARIVRQGSEAANRRDFKSLFLFFDTGIEFHPAPSLVGGFVPPDQIGVVKGRPGYTRMWQGLLEAWEDIRLEPDEVVDYGDRLLIAGRIKGHGSHSGIALDIPLFQVLFLRRGLLVQQKDFGDRDQALEAAGLRE
jgi:SnoaL-like domain